MPNATLRIKIGASTDASVTRAFDDVIRQSKRARDAVQRDMGKVGGSGGGPYRTNARVVSSELDTVKKKSAEAGAALGKVASDADKKFKALADSVKASGASLAQVTKEAQRELSRLERQQARKALGLPSGGGGSRGKGPSFFGYGGTLEREAQWKTARGILGAGTGIAGAAIGGAKMISQAMGVDLDPASLIRKNVELQSLTTDISNSGFMPTDETGRNKKRVDPAELQKDIFKVAQTTGNETGTVASGLQKFVGLTGDLATARETLGDIAKISNATGSSFDDVAASAGNVSNALEDGPDKAQRVLAVMRAIAGQGKLGAVEMRDLASQLAGLSANASRFTGAREGNIVMLGALAQEARQKGGSKSAAQAVTSVQSFSATFDKGAREKAFAAMGIKLRGKDQLLRSAQDIITESLVKTKGNAHKMGTLFADTRARSVTRGFESIFNETMNKTQGDEQTKLKAATAAVAEEFDRLKNAAMTQAEVDESNAAKMSTDAAKSAQANAELQKAMGEFVTAIKPALTDFVSALAEGAKAVVGFVKGVASWMKADDLKDPETDKALVEAQKDQLSAQKEMKGGLEASTDTIAKNKSDQERLRKIKTQTDFQYEEYLKEHDDIKEGETPHDQEGLMLMTRRNTVNAALALSEKQGREMEVRAGRNTPGMGLLGVGEGPSLAAGGGMGLEGMPAFSGSGIAGAASKDAGEMAAAAAKLKATGLDKAAESLMRAAATIERSASKMGMPGTSGPEGPHK